MHSSAKRFVTETRKGAVNAWDMSSRMTWTAATAVLLVSRVPTRYQRDNVPPSALSCSPQSIIHISSLPTFSPLPDDTVTLPINTVCWQSIFSNVKACVNHTDAAWVQITSCTPLWSLTLSHGHLLEIVTTAYKSLKFAVFERSERRIKFL